MTTSKSKYNTESPTKILNKAQHFSKTLENQVELPKQISKSYVVKTKAQQQAENIDYAIQMVEYQKQIFKFKENQDVAARNKLRDRIDITQKKNENNLVEVSKKKVKKSEDYDKHIKQVFRKFTEQERNKRMAQKQESNKLRQELKEFYENSKARKLQKQNNQVKVGTCYQSAVEKINELHRQNEIYARKAELSLEKNLRKNNKFSERIGYKRRLVSECNRRKSRVYSHSIDIAQNNKLRYIQTCGKNEDDYLQAWDKKGKTITEWRKKRSQSNKRDFERWKQNKYRVDQANSSVSQKCLGILDKTSRATYRKTASTFRHSASKFQEEVQKNKEQIREEDEFKKDQIMDMHIDLTLRNTASAKVAQKMHSMRQHARKLADDFL